MKYTIYLLSISLLLANTCIRSTELDQLEVEMVWAENSLFIQQIEQLLKTNPAPTPNPTPTTSTQTSTTTAAEEQETQDIVNNVAGMVGNFIAIAQNPHDPTSVGTHLSGLIANFINIAIYAFKDERTRLAHASAQEIIATIDPLFIETLKMAILRRALQLHKIYKNVIQH